MIKDDLSIFDTNKTWYFNWKSESRTSFPSLVGIDIDDKSKEIIEAVASVGLITDKQLFYFYKVRKKHLDHMRHIKMLVEHQINIANEKGDMDVLTVYTLGKIGAKILNLPHYKTDYWRSYRKNEVYKRIMFFEFFHRFKKGFEHLDIYPGISPFTGAIRYKNSIMEVFIYSDKEDFYNIMNFLRWKNSFNRMIFIASDLKSFHQLKPHLEDKQVRYLKEADILNNDKLNGKFHVLKEREFVIE